MPYHNKLSKHLPIDVFEDYLGATIYVFHDSLGEIIGRVLKINDTGNPNSDWIKMECYKPDNTLDILYFSPQRLNNPQYYTGKFPPYKFTPSPGREPSLPKYQRIDNSQQYNLRYNQHQYDAELQSMYNWLYGAREPFYTPPGKYYYEKLEMKTNYNAAVEQIQKAKYESEQIDKLQKIIDEAQKYPQSKPTAEIAKKDQQQHIEEYNAAVSNFHYFKDKYETTKKKIKEDRSV